MNDELIKLKTENKDLNELCTQLEDEVHYLKLREKKIMYLVHLMQNKGYPV
jgi:predicted nuclease with TOPRIM domain